MKRFAYVPLASLALALGLGTPAHATTVLFTGATLAENNQEAVCVLTNVGTQTASITVTPVNASTGSDATILDYCPAILAPGVSCQVWGPVGTMTYCKFTSSSSKVRGVLDVIAANAGVVSSIPATK
jgi:hypothetical protein